MTTPQKPRVRLNQKIRRTKKLALWRLANPKQAEVETKTEKKAAKPVAAKPAKAAAK